MQDVASYLPDMKFVVNPGTQPRALKYNYLKGGIKEEFFCDNGFERPKHGLFIQPCSWNPNYDSSLSLAPQKSLSAFLTFYFLLGQPITHRSESDGRTSNSEVSGGGHRRAETLGVGSAREKTRVESKFPSRISIGKSWSRSAQKLKIATQSSLSTRSAPAPLVSKCGRCTESRSKNRR